MPAESTEPIEVFLIEDDDAFAAAVESVVPSSIRFTRARSAQEASAITERPAAAVVDLGLPDGDGVELIRSLNERFPGLPIVVLTHAHDPKRVLAAFRAGACGYLFKEDADRLDVAVREACAGGAPMSRDVARWVLQWARGSSGTPATTESELTRRELDLIRLLADGCSYGQAAAAMGVSVNTIRTHVRNVYDKLAVGNRTEAVMTALRLGLLERP